MGNRKFCFFPLVHLNITNGLPIKKCQICKPDKAKKEQRKRTIQTLFRETLRLFVDFT